MNGRLMIALDGDAELTAEDKRRLAMPAVGGVILFARNFVDSAQLRRLTAAVRVAAGARALLIAVDQEGGRVQRFAGGQFSAVPAMSTIAAAARPQELAQACGLILAAELLSHGVDLTFAPVLDIAHGRSEIIGSRAFSSAAEVVADLALHLAKGLRQGGMAACGKHFPGHGYAIADSHETLPVDARDLATLMEYDVPPFARWATASQPLLMTAHIIYSAVDEANAATFSARWLREILRRQLRYQGLLVTDDLCMAGAAAVGDMTARVQAAVAAGCDLLLVCQSAQADEAIAAVAAHAPKNDDARPEWSQLLYSSRSRVGVGDAAYRNARALLVTNNDGR